MDTVDHISINIKELTGAKIKKALGAKSCTYRWHNKNKSGGNFGINILGINNVDYQLTGYYKIDGEIFGLRFGYIYQNGKEYGAKNFSELMDLLNIFIIPDLQLDIEIKKRISMT